ncbi:hypothetical protein KC19_2G212100 [Ceratodon purpureus]|uniref:Uncharacterized protein n=1 Tax=Ceratodon purpureus TaxID=3225 RepID=A0A8T0IZ90_CERPU|nr:hypothetical protein KC19_2G212100 [Ceratodon purpureus]
MDTVQFSLKKASKLVKAIGGKIATDGCIKFFLFLIAVGIVAIITVKVIFSTYLSNTSLYTSVRRF